MSREVYTLDLKGLSARQNVVIKPQTPLRDFLQGLAIAVVGIALAILVFSM